MVEGVEGDNGGVSMDGEDNPTDEIRYNGEGKKNRCMNREHAEGSLKRTTTKLARSEEKTAIQLRSRKHRPSLLT